MAGTAIATLGRVAAGMPDESIATRRYDQVTAKKRERTARPRFIITEHGRVVKAFKTGLARMESMRPRLHRRNVLASYRDLEPRGDRTAFELFVSGVRLLACTKIAQFVQSAP
jgi:hypothetical protein